jgi:hypothetical protein
MKRYKVSLREFEPGERHVNQEGMIPPEARTAEALARFMLSCGVEARVADGGNALEFNARSRKSASRIVFGALCNLASESYRAEGRWWIANRDSGFTRESD